jgi:hypothetical protein
VRKTSWRHPLLDSGLLKDASAAVNMHTAVEELSKTRLHLKTRESLGKNENRSWVPTAPETKIDCAGEAGSNLPDRQVDSRVA